MQRKKFWSLRFWVAMVGVLIFLGLAGSIALSAKAKEGVDMQEGLWETTMEITVEGMPFQMPPQKMTQCITKEDLIPKTSEKEEEENCKIIEQKIIGNKVTWKAVCVDKEGKVEIEGEITYSGTTFKGTIRMKGPGERGETINSITKLTGRRIGDCPKTTSKPVGQTIAQQLLEQKEKHEKEAKIREEEVEAFLKEWKSISTSLLPPKDAYALKDWSSISSPECERKWGKLNIQEGEWEIAEEVRELHLDTLVLRGQSYIDKKDGNFTECLKRDRLLPCFVREDPRVRDIKRSGNKLIWKIQETENWSTELGGEISYWSTDTEGGGEISYSGNTFKGTICTKYKDSGNYEVYTITKLTGRRIGGECYFEDKEGRSYTTKPRWDDYTSQEEGRSYTTEERRDYTSEKRSYTSQERKTKSKEKLNPIKSIRKKFGL
ncbi:MAG: DUF3617 domain-containing protein [bacterium]